MTSIVMAATPQWQLTILVTGLFKDWDGYIFVVPPSTWPGLTPVANSLRLSRAQAVWGSLGGRGEQFQCLLKIVHCSEVTLTFQPAQVSCSPLPRTPGKGSGDKRLMSLCRFMHCTEVTQLHFLDGLSPYALHSSWSKQVAALQGSLQVSSH